MAKETKPKVWAAKSKHWPPYGDLLLKLLDRPISTPELYRAASDKYQWDSNFTGNVAAWCRINGKVVYAVLHRVWHLPDADLSKLTPAEMPKHPGTRRGKRAQTKGEDDGDDPVDTDVFLEYSDPGE